MARTLDDRVLDKLLPEYTGFASRPNDIVKSFDDYSTETIRQIPRGQDGKIYITNKTEDATVPVELQAAQPIDSKNFNEVLNTEFTFFVTNEIASRFENGTFVREVVGNVDPHAPEFIVYFKESGYLRQIPNYQTLEVMLAEREITYNSIEVVNRGALANERIGFVMDDRISEYNNVVRYRSGYRPLAKRAQTIQEKFINNYEGKLVSWGYSVPDGMKILIRGVWRPLWFRGAWDTGISGYDQKYYNSDRNYTSYTDFVRANAGSKFLLGQEMFKNMLQIVQLYGQVNGLPTFELDGATGLPIISKDGKVELNGYELPSDEAVINSLTPSSVSYYELEYAFQANRYDNRNNMKARYDIGYYNLLSYANDLERIRRNTYQELGSGGALNYLPTESQVILTIEEYQEYLLEGVQFEKDYLQPYESPGSVAFFETNVRPLDSLQTRIFLELNPQFKSTNLDSTTGWVSIQEPGQVCQVVKEDRSLANTPAGAASNTE